MNNENDIISWENQAARALANGDTQSALQAHEQAIALAKTLNRPRLLAVLYNRLGNALEVDNRIQAAVIAYESGLKALAGEASSDLDQVLHSIRMVRKGFDAEFAFLETPDLYSEATATDLATAEADPTLAVKLLINIGNAYLRQPQMDPARNAYERALEQDEIAAAPVLRAHALTHLGIIHRRQNRIDEAERALREALDLLDRHDAPAEKRRALATLASIYREQGEHDRALQTYQEALALYQQSDDPRGEARTLAALGHLYLLADQQEDARASFQRAVQLAEAVRDEDTLWHAYWGMGVCQHRAGDFDAAASAFRHSLDKIKWRRRELRTDEGKVTFLESVQDIFDHLLAVHLDQAQNNRAAYQAVLQVAEEARGQALYELMGTRRRHLHSRQAGIRPTRLRSPQARHDSPAQMAPGIPLDRNMAVQMAPGVESPQLAEFTSAFMDPLWDEDIGDLYNRRELAASIPSTVPRWPDDVEPAAASPDLPPLARLVFHVLADRTAVLAVASDGTVYGHVAELGDNELSQQVATVRQALQVDESPRSIEVTRHMRPVSTTTPMDYRALLRSLYAELIAPVAAHLPANGTPVVIEPHGPLWLLPFAALLSDDDQWLVDRWPLLYAPSAQVLDEIRNEPDYGGPTQLKPLIVGNPVMPEIPNQHGVEITLNPLPGAEAECRAIDKIFVDAETNVLLGPNADWTQVVSQMPHHGIIHLATHGLASAESPLNSFIALGQPDPQALEQLTKEATPSPTEWLLSAARAQAFSGLLTAEQMLSMPLPADLITLSACQTGLGQIAGDGMIGLSRALLVAGARAVLVSLWSVSDSATAELMTAFYQGYLTLDDKAIALQRAMQQLRGTPGYEHPRFWASFVVVGTEA